MTKETKLHIANAVLRILQKETGKSNYGVTIVIFETDENGKPLRPTNASLITSATPQETIGMLNEAIRIEMQLMQTEN